MSLFGAIRIATNTLQADQIAMQVIGQNIANANTPGYIREDVVLSPAPTQRKGGLLLGLGVEVEAVIQKIDRFLEDRLRGSVSDKSSGESLEKIYTQLENLIGELSETDISTAMTEFFNSVSEVLNQPEDLSVRNLAVLNGNTLAQEIGRLAERATNLRWQVNDRVVQIADEINRYVEEIRVLNVQIAETEGGSVSKSDAVGLRDRRLMALENMAKLIDIRVEEQPSGTVTVYSGGDYLVTDGFSRPVKSVIEPDRGLGLAHIHFVETDARMEPRSGELHGILTARDDVLAGFLDDLDGFAGTLINEFNRVFSNGQGLHGYREIASTNYVYDPAAPLNQAGLKYSPVNGSFQVQIYDTKTQLTRTVEVHVDLNGITPGTQMSLNRLRDAMNSIEGNPLEAETTPEGRLVIRSKSPVNEFAFGNDTSGVLASLGINTFFTGTGARDIGVNGLLKKDPALLAASLGGIGADTKNVIDMSQFIDKPLTSQNGASISVLYDRMVGKATQGATVCHAAAEGARVFEQTLRGEKLAISGVSIDEEAVHMIAFQHSFQAAARFIKTVSELLELLSSL